MSTICTPSALTQQQGTLYTNTVNLMCCCSTCTSFALTQRHTPGYTIHKHGQPDVLFNLHLLLYTNTVNLMCRVQPAPPPPLTSGAPRSPRVRAALRGGAHRRPPSRGGPCPPASSPPCARARTGTSCRCGARGGSTCLPRCSVPEQSHKQQQGGFKFKEHCYIEVYVGSVGHGVQWDMVN